MNVDTFLTELYVMVDDFCKTLPPAAPRRGPAPALTLSEVVTLMVFSQWGRFSGERDFYRYAQRRLRVAFPTLPSRPQFNRQTRGVLATVTAFTQYLAQQLGA